MAAELGAKVVALDADIGNLRTTLDKVFAQQAQGVEEEVGKVSDQLYRLHEGVKDKVTEIEERIKKIEMTGGGTGGKRNRRNQKHDPRQAWEGRGVEAVEDGRGGLL